MNSEPSWGTQDSLHYKENPYANLQSKANHIWKGPLGPHPGYLREQTPVTSWGDAGNALELQKDTVSQTHQIQKAVRVWRGQEAGWSGPKGRWGEKGLKVTGKAEVVGASWGVVSEAPGCQVLCRSLRMTERNVRMPGED